MRRSCAPSMRKGALCQSGKSSDRAIKSVQRPETSEEMPWGTKEHAASGTIKKSPLEGKRIFRVLWRDMSTKKHKTWKGEGTFLFDLNSKKAVLKDDSGKYMGSITLFNVDKLGEGLEITVAHKEIELQDEIKEIESYFKLMKDQMANRGWGEDEWQSPEEKSEKKPKGSFVFRPNLVLDNINKPTTSFGLKATKRKREYLDSKPKYSKDECKNDGKNFDANDSDHDVSKLELKKPKNSCLSIPKLFLNGPKIDSTKSFGREQTEPMLLTNEDPERNETNTEIVVASSLSQHLRPHQREGVAFIYACLMGYKQPGYFGCILADEMGLGKTLQCLTVAHTMLRPVSSKAVVHRVLIVTPSCLVANWNNEVNKWLKSERIFSFVVNQKHKLSSYSKAHHMPLVIVSYETLASQKEDFAKLEFDLLICDEGHRLSNQSAKIFKTLCDLNIARRLIMTGTPVQNNLQEFYALADFVNPGILGTYQEFRRRFEIPFQHCQDPTATEDDQHLAADRSEELNELTAKFLLRRLQHINCQYLPKKTEYICFLRPSKLQQFILQKALELYEQRKDTILKDLTAFQIISILKKICNHPSLISHSSSPNLLTRNLERYLPKWDEMGPFDSAKLDLVQNLLNAVSVAKGEKCVLVSHHTKTLDMLQSLCAHMNLQYVRLDGSMAIADRNRNVEKFNTSGDSGDNPLVFLLSAKAGGVGLNLVGASTLILYDNDWNPAIDAQAVSRIWRDGQTKDIQIYRLVTAGCIEEKIFQRQMSKVSMGDCVMSDGTQSMKFSPEDLLDLFKLQDDFLTCKTHCDLDCNCNGDGQNIISEGATDQFRAINELKSWQHYGSPFDEVFLESANFKDCESILLYVFCNRVNT